MEETTKACMDSYAKMLSLSYPEELREEAYAVNQDIVNLGTSFGHKLTENIKDEEGNFDISKIFTGIAKTMSDFSSDPEMKDETKRVSESVIKVIEKSGEHSPSEWGGKSLRQIGAESEERRKKMSGDLDGVFSALIGKDYGKTLLQSISNPEEDEDDLAFDITSTIFAKHQATLKAKHISKKKMMDVISLLLSEN